MSAQPKKKWGNVDLGLLHPVETLHPDSFKLFSKEEISAYLQYYGMNTLWTLKRGFEDTDLLHFRCRTETNQFLLTDVPFTSSDTKPELKRQLRMLISSIKEGTTAKRDGIGSDLKKPSPGRPGAPSSSSNHGTSSSTKPTPSHITLQGHHPISSPTTSYLPHQHSQPSHGVAGSSTGASSASQGKPSYLPTEAVERPAILDEGLEFSVPDHSMPNTVSRLESQYPHITPRMYRYYYSLVDKHEHLAPALKPVVARAPFEPPQSGSVGAGRCVACGKTAIASCDYDRCKSCCQLQHGTCRIHQKLKHEFAFIARPLDRTGSVITTLPSNNALTSTSNTSMQKTAPPTPKAAQTILGNFEAAHPWSELREEALHRATLNNAAMENIFSAQSVAKLSHWIEEWTAQKNPPNASAVAQELDAMEDDHAKKMKQWQTQAEVFQSHYEALAQGQNDQQKRAEIFGHLEDFLPVPLTHRKRVHADN